MEARLSSKAESRRPPALFAFGFRPFFLLAGLYAAFVLPVWLALHHSRAPWPFAWPTALWHAHEMLLGYASAALAGFLLTAVPGWQKTPPVTGARLAGLAALWLAGRLAMWFSGFLPAGLVAAVDLAFLPVLLAVGAPGLLSPRAKRNRIFVAVIAILVAGNALMYAAAAGLVGERLGAGLALDGFILLITILGGRIVPAFTANALAPRGLREAVKQRPLLDRLALASVAAVVIADALAELRPETAALAGAIAAFAAIVNGMRLAGWGWRHTLGAPILWILHLAYGWLVVGLAARALAAFGVILPLTAMHALAVGAIGSMTIAVMSRAALGHTGRPLVAPWPVAMAYGLVSVAAVARMVGGPVALEVAGTAWTAAFVAFSIVFVPILTSPRPDGRPG